MLYVITHHQKLKTKFSKNSEQHCAQRISTATRSAILSLEKDTLERFPKSGMSKEHWVVESSWPVTKVEYVPSSDIDIVVQ